MAKKSVEQRPEEALYVGDEAEFSMDEDGNVILPSTEPDRLAVDDVLKGQKKESPKGTEEES